MHRAMRGSCSASPRRLASTPISACTHVARPRTATHHTARNTPTEARVCDQIRRCTSISSRSSASAAPATSLMWPEKSSPLRMFLECSDLGCDQFGTFNGLSVRSVRNLGLCAKGESPTGIPFTSGFVRGAGEISWPLAVQLALAAMSINVHPQT
jgi:hypothetical protein